MYAVPHRRLVVAFALLLTVTCGLFYLCRIPGQAGCLDANMDHQVGIVQTTCGAAGVRGFGQKVVSYSIYGNFSDPYVEDRYLTALRAAVHGAKLAYPGWTVRVHHNLSSQDPSWAVLQGIRDGNVDLCNVTEVVRNGTPSLFAMTWRFLPLLDDMVDMFMSRDADSLILQREVDAVQEWLSSDKAFHIMRDHGLHCIAMLGGMWGAKVANKRPLVQKKAEEMLFSKPMRNERGYDQDLLATYIWPIAKLDQVSHDSMCCKKFASRPFPSKRIGMNFVGMVGPLTNSTFNKHLACPLKCRPKQGLDWNFC